MNFGATLWSKYNLIEPGTTMVNKNNNIHIAIKKIKKKKIQPKATIITSFRNL